MQAAMDELSAVLKVAVTGYQGGTIACWPRRDSSLTQFADMAGIHANSEREPQVPTMLHFGDKDMHIPMAQNRSANPSRHPGSRLSGRSRLPLRRARPGRGGLQAPWRARWNTSRKHVG
jgi:hypothetical protein